MSGTERSILSIAEVAAGRALVERPAPGKAPTAFRIWGYGPNDCDGKTVVFSERSAEALVAEQTARARLYSFDFDHRSMMQDVSPEAGKAAGWHVLEVREYEGKPELWASSCDWTAEARSGLEADPPEWRYFSPCYDIDPKTREVLSYTVCALTNNPLTHGIPALASAVAAPSVVVGRLQLSRANVRLMLLSPVTSNLTPSFVWRGKPMDPKELIAALGIYADPKSTDEDKAAALDKLTAYFNSLLDSKESGESEAASETGESGEGESKDEPDPKKDEPSKEMASALAQIDALTKRVAKMEKASAVGNAPRASKPTVIPRKESPAPADPVTQMIDNALAASRRNAGK